MRAAWIEARQFSTDQEANMAKKPMPKGGKKGGKGY